jgi:putative addiction module antidote
MPVEIKVLKVGDSLGIVLPKQILAMLDIREGDIVRLVESEDHSLQLTIEKPDSGVKAQAVLDLMNRFPKTFRELS